MKGSDKTFGEWLGVNWIWLAVVGVMLSCVAVLGYKIFSTYAEQLPYISNDHTAWASFGSLLAGFFTLTGTVATVATLLFLAHQNKAMQKVTQMQLATMTFERYINHRKLFIEQLKDLEIAHKNAFNFCDPNLLYKTIFPENGPHKCEFSVESKFDANGDYENLISEIYFRFEELVERFNVSQFNKGDGDLLARCLINFHDRVLMVEPVGAKRNGDIEFNSVPYFINIFSIEEFVRAAVKISNHILRFTNNNEVDGSRIFANSKFVRYAMMDDYFRPVDNQRIEIVTSIFGIKALESIHRHAFRMRDSENEFLLPVTFRTLDNIFSSAELVNGLADDEVLNEVVEDCIEEVGDYLQQMKVDSPNFSMVNKISDKLIALRNR